MTLEQAAEVFAAAAVGKEIQVKRADGWHDRSPLSIHDLLTLIQAGCELRVKPEPKVMYCLVYCDGSLSSPLSDLCDAKRLSHYNTGGGIERYIQDVDWDGESE